MDYTLRPADPAELKVILEWIDSPHALMMWGGDLLTYPPEVEKTWREIGADGGNTFAFVDADGSIAGFGQTLPKEQGRVHLGRIIVSPDLRGQGLGRVLVRMLIDSVSENFHPETITLNVYHDNLPAVRLYQSLGFEVVSEDEGQASLRMRLNG